MNRQLSQRLNDIERLTDQLRNNNTECDELHKLLDAEKRKFEGELDSQMQAAKDKIKDEKEKMDALISRTVENLTSLGDNKVKVLEEEIGLLKGLLDGRRGDLETQRETLVVQRDSYRLEIEKLEQENKSLRLRIEEITRDNLSSIEALKVKMGVLH